MLENVPAREFDILGIGEVMLRLSPEGKDRISQSESFEKHAGGSELNVVSGISQLGLRTGIVTRLPDNEIGKFIKNKIRYTGTSDDFVTYDASPEKRLGIYYYESGAYPRVSVVAYDRTDSSFVRFSLDELDPKIFFSCKVFHLSGITLALGSTLRRQVIGMIRRFHENGTLISFDVNYRAALWSEEEARETVEAVLPFVNLFFVSEETLRRMLGRKGELTVIHREIAKEYPNLKMIASTQRTVISPTRHNFGSVVYDVEKDRHYAEEPYREIEVVDRIGSGDAYVAGALYGILKYHDIEHAAQFGDAMSAIKNTIPGDMTVCDLHDVERVIKTHLSTGPKNEMVR